MSMHTASEIIRQLNEAKNLAFSSKETFPQVLRQILNFVNNPEPSIKLWCSTFLKDSFQSDESVLGNADKMDLAMDSLDSLIILSNEKHLEIFENVINSSIVIFKLVFKYVNENDGCDDVWAKLNQLKISLTSKFSTTFPLDSSDNEEHDRYRNLITKIQLIKFIVLVIDYQTKSDNDEHFNLNSVHPNHSLIKRQAIQAEAHGLLDNLLSVFEYDTLVTPLMNPLLFQLSLLVKRKSQFIPKILSCVEKFDTHEKLQSNYQTLDEFKLSRKYVDRLLRIFIGYVFKNRQLPSNLQQSLGQKLTILTERGDDVRRKNILAAVPQDANIKKKRFDGFINGSKTLKSLDYKNLYCLTNPADELNNFDLASLPQHTLISMTIAALNRVDPKKLNKALGIVAERYKYALSNSSLMDGTDNEKFEGDDDDNEGFYDSGSVYSLPPPKELSYQEKRDQINLIIQNFLRVSQMSTEELEDGSKDEGESQSDGVSSELTKIAIKHWQKGSWIVVLTRLATRGMNSNYESGSIDEEKNNELSDMIRNAIFDYFLENIHSRIDVIIEWLNEEWYSEVVNKELKLKNEIKTKILQDYEAGKVEDLDGEINKQFATLKENIDTPQYSKWSAKVLDSIIPFLESKDRKIFIRLLSDLPLLTDELVGRIKSLCLDPVRIKLGFLSLQYLIMYRPPVKQACLNILQDLSESDQDDLKEEATKLLTKYK
ncbi:hypothetical protein CANTEDRAFT_120101 [Yamadazyma tenuis ATCC 10573]|uniref:Symplekin/Pta1 N-terminal domain-containing protein n=1 Tax=Candida tenuis (strain ATCC 10573 / BCRC 21748 / CBS 615 / JCM 9827 / NBRC 10315 / NRRL Y-1498 / VKM Y-70) TaxID=590646 RepID=G3B1T8_CANTC|nr:uncharacterized protein CANTEDRAFT_120101 [Yamadazyma tenuis ATCC 10573]EGV64530.1 hypothetical protein CANTEDRAFT_120101 [Yamadazyma tenuis ATCC 10573]